MMPLRHALTTLCLCLAIAAGPFTHGFLSARGGAAEAGPAQTALDLAHHCDGALAADAAAPDPSHPSDHAKAKAGGCLTLCCAMAAATTTFDASAPMRPRAVARRVPAEVGGVVRPPLPPPRG